MQSEYEKMYPSVEAWKENRLQIHIKPIIHTEREEKHNVISQTTPDVKTDMSNSDANTEDEDWKWQMVLWKR